MAAPEASRSTGECAQDVVENYGATGKPSAPSGTSPEESSDGAKPRSSSTEGDRTRVEDDAAPDTSNENQLDRVPSQAQKLGKKKIAVVMGALCVCCLSPLVLLSDHNAKLISWNM